MNTQEILRRMPAPRSTWDKGILKYCEELLDELFERGGTTEQPWGQLRVQLLNGARNWQEYSDGGCALVMDEEIAERLCTPSELRKLRRKDGTLRERPNGQETWLQCQARALRQAERKLCRALA